MDNLDNAATSQTEVSQLREQYESLRHLVTSMLVLVVVLSGTFSIFMWRQWKTNREDLNNFRPGATQLIADYNKVTAPIIADFVKKLKDYYKGHPDFDWVAKKYSLSQTPTGAPASPAPQKK
jgi:hypothetical protein